MKDMILTVKSYVVDIDRQITDDNANLKEDRNGLYLERTFKN